MTPRPSARRPRLSGLPTSMALSPQRIPLRPNETGPVPPWSPAQSGFADVASRSAIDATSPVESVPPRYGRNARLCRSTPASRPLLAMSSSGHVAAVAIRADRRLGTPPPAGIPEILPRVISSAVTMTHRSGAARGPGEEP